MTNNTRSATNIPKLDLVSRNPEAAAALSKAIRPTLSTGFDVGKRSTYYSLNESRIKEIADNTSSRINDNDNILNLFPDIALAEQIVVSSILAPKDMFRGSLIYKTYKQLIPTEIQTKINAIVQENLEGHYRYRSELPEILRAALFQSGSYVSAVIPEASVDEVINGKSIATEAHHRAIESLIEKDGRIVSLGILGPAKRESNGAKALENFFSGAHRVPTTGSISLEALSEYVGVGKNTDGFLEVTDNFHVLKLPQLMAAVAEQRIRRATSMYGGRSVGMENMGVKTEGAEKKLTQNELSNLIYKNKNAVHEPFMVFPTANTQKRHSIGRPLRIKIPSEAVVPVFPPGDPSNHRGYFVLVDIDGNWITRSSVDTTPHGLMALVGRNQQNNSMSGMLLDKARLAIRDGDKTTTIDNMLEVYSSIVEHEMMSRLQNGVYGTRFEFGRDKEWDRIMLARALAGKMTRMVYIPSSVITYYAYDYHPNGVGKSYLDNIRLLTSIRATLLFSKVMGNLKSSINTTKVSLNIDPKDPDPLKTIEMASHDVMRFRQSYFPLGVTAPSDLLHWIQRAGLMFEFKGHPGLPETSFQFSNETMQHHVPDDQIGEDLRKQTFMAFGLTPETVDQGFNADFATTIIHNNALFAKRISLLSDLTSVHMSKDAQNICRNDSIILDSIVDVLSESGESLVRFLDEEEKAHYNADPKKFVRMFVDRVIDNLWLDLPKPEVTGDGTKTERFEEVAEALDKVLTSFFSPEVFGSSLTGEMSSHIDEIKGFWKHFLLRKWVTEEGYMPEISEIFRRDENGNPSNDILDIMKNYTQDAMLSAMKYIEQATKIREATDKDLQTLGTATGSPSPTPSDDSAPESEETGDGTDIPDADIGELPPEEESETKEE